MDGAPGPRTQRQIERELEAELSYARRVFERASRNLAEQVSAISEMPPQDGVVCLRSARQQVDLAYAGYQEALRRFTEFAAHGTIPPSLSQSAAHAGTDPLSDAAAG
jgi:hypothetical protein